jgi:hypothetical protein
MIYGAIPSSLFKFDSLNLEIFEMTKEEEKFNSG